MDAPQPGPYYAIETGSVRIICIDTGTSGTIDREQGEWLCRISADDKPKLLFTGRPLYVNHQHKPCRIEWDPSFSKDRRPERTGDDAPRKLEGDEKLDRPGYATVDALVRDPKRRFIAAIGGDVHNYQRYPVSVAADGEGEGARTVQYIVSGGGGAFLSPTHIIEDASPGDHAGITEDEFRCYPLRGDSLARFSRGSSGRLRWAMLALAGVTLLLLYLAVLAWNPGDGTLRGWQVAGVRVLNPDPEDGVLVDWLPGWDYDRYTTRGLGVALVLVGAALVLLPWFRLRARAVIALVALVAAGFLWDVIGAATFFGAATVAALALVVLPREAARELPVWGRALAVGALVVLAVVLANTGDSLVWEFLTGMAAFGALAVLLVGGPPITLLSSGLAGVAIGALAVLLWAIEAGFFWLVLGGLGVGAGAFTLYVTVALRWVLAVGGKVDGDQAAGYVAGLLSGVPTRTAAPAGGGGWARIREHAARQSLKALLPRPGRRRRLLLYGGETMYSALFDYNDQPFLKSFLRVEVRGGAVKIYCFGVTAEDATPTVEDHVKWDPALGWTTARAILGPTGGDGVRGEVDYYRRSPEELELVFDLGDGRPVTGRYWLYLRRDGDSPWEQVATLDYDAPGARCRLSAEPPSRGWFKEVGLSRAVAREDPAPDPGFAIGTFV